MAHFANGKKCECFETPTSMGIPEYAAAHPNKKDMTGGRWPQELTFNQTCDNAKKTRAVNQSRGY